ncbi:hypothetical protein Gohar_012394 [Gossypium harknessii]|uniref:t-SNARE coiled-coil homology domain-containing protein n=1 Tax=Gossypium harknessii TaxID=34285 RepID=A0A7J9GYB2_9ROSI|nr:hypothetical protein [Gossypium harknessii]
MSFQDVQTGGGARSSSSSYMASKSPSQAVAAGIFQINTAVAAFRRLVDAIGTAKDTPDHRLKLHNTRQRILQLVKETSAKLKALTEPDHDPTVNPSKKVEDAKLARDFQNTLQEFQKVQQLASERESTYSPAPPPPSLPTTLDAFDAAALAPMSRCLKRNNVYLWNREGEFSSSVARAPFIYDPYSSKKMCRQEVILLDNEIGFNEAMIDEREQGIREVEEQIGQVNEIFKDLAVLVHEQGVVIGKMPNTLLEIDYSFMHLDLSSDSFNITDDISSNIDASSVSTTQARGQLAKASKSVKPRTSWVSRKLLISRLLLDMKCLIFVAEILVRKCDLQR